EGGEQHQAGAIGERENSIGNLLGGLLGDLQAADGAVGVADAGVEQAHVVPDLRDGADGGARVVRGALLVYGDGRGEAVNVVNIGLLNLAEELASIGGERLDVAALALGEDGIKGEAALARAGEAGDNDQPVARDGDIYVFEVVLAGAANDDAIRRH